MKKAGHAAAPARRISSISRLITLDYQERDGRFVMRRYNDVQLYALMVWMFRWFDVLRSCRRLVAAPPTGVALACDHADCRRRVGFAALLRPRGA